MNQLEYKKDYVTGNLHHYYYFLNLSVHTIV